MLTHAINITDKPLKVGLVEIQPGAPVTLNAVDAGEFAQAGLLRIVGEDEARAAHMRALGSAAAAESAAARPAPKAKV